VQIVASFVCAAIGCYFSLTIWILGAPAGIKVEKPAKPINAVSHQRTG
jgi:hypothetical protein